jgi:hypothetical protein
MRSQRDHAASSAGDKKLSLTSPSPNFIFSCASTFILALAFFSFLQPWGSFRDPDSFYHAQLSNIIIHGTSVLDAQILRIGPFSFLQNFPWLDLTLLNDHFVDQHLLYHLALTPFIAAFGALDGTQLATIFFAAFFITTFYAALRFLRLQHPSLWTFLIAVSMPLSFRLSLGKATPFALSFFVIGIVSLFSYLGLRRPGLFASEYVRSYQDPMRSQRESTTSYGASQKDLAAGAHRLFFSFLAGLGFALSHGGWIILPISQLLILSSIWLFRRYANISSAISSYLAPLLATVLGIATAILIHPNRANLLAFLKVQVFQVAIATPRSIQLGLEWSSITPTQLIANIAPLLMMGCVAVLGLLFASRRPREDHRLEGVVGLAPLVCALTLFTLKSSRMVEYLVPVLALWLAMLWTMTDTKKLSQELKQIIIEQYKTKIRRTVPTWLPRVVAGCMVTAFIMVVVRDIRGTVLSLRLGRPFQRLVPIVNRLSKEAEPSERIFYDRWDSFGELFFFAPQFHYISGVDPTFLLASRPDLAYAYEHATKDLDAELPQIFQTRFSLVERRSTCRGKNQQIKEKSGGAILCE